MDTKKTLTLAPLLRSTIAIAAAFYLLINTSFLLPAAYFFWQYERAR